MKFMKIFILSLVCLVTTSTYAQLDESCGTTVSTKEIALINERLEQFNSQRARGSSWQSSEEIIYIAIAAHIVRRADGSGGLSEEQLISAIEYLNESYESMNMNFFLLGDINYIDSDGYYDFDSSQEAGITEDNNVENAINIYFYNSLSSGSSSLCGYAYFPSTGRDHIMMANGCTVNQGSTLPHEVGHYFNLYHTHGKTNNGTTDELVDGSNCETAGDDLCDTPADPNLSGKVNSNCVYEGTSTDSNGQAYAPDPRNFMSYAPGFCRVFFTGDQKDRIVTAYQTFKTYLIDKYYTANFSALERRICEGGTIAFTDKSIAASSITWQFEGGTPSTSTEKFPVVTYNSAGKYDVTLTIETESGDSEVKTLTDYVTVVDESDGIASTSGSFEEVTLEEEVINEDLDFTFEITSDASSEGTQSVKMNFADYSTIGAEDYLLADKLLTSVNKYFEFSFDYAYARYDDQYFDKLAIVIKNSCGEWFEVWSRSGADLATAEDHESPFVPEVGEWKSESFIISIPANYSNTEIAFKAVNGFGNNLYIDNYAITPITPSFSIESIDVTNAICPSESNGEIELSVSGSGSYTYQLDNSLFQSSSVFENLSPGNYTVSVKDDSETIIRSFASVGPDPIEYELDISNPSCNGDLGMVQFSLEGGTGNLEINFNDEGFTNQLEYTELESGNYSFSIQDSNGCTVEGTFKIKAINSTPSKPRITKFSSILSFEVASDITSIQWFLDGEPVEGATGSTLANPEFGVYTVSVSNGFCSRLSYPFVILTVDEVESQLVISPNPVEDKLSFKLPIDLQKSIDKIQLHDLSGRLIKEETFSEEIDLSDIKGGLYMIRLSTEDGMVTRKIIKK